MPTRFSLQLAILTAFALTLPALAQDDQSREYSDGARGKVTLPQGDKSFADAVVSYTAGTGTISKSAQDPDVVLGPPDFSGNVNDGSFLSLGCNGSVVMQFTDNALIDGEGFDLYVFEVGPRIEGMSLAVSEDGSAWTEVGDIEGGRAEVELAGQVPADTNFRFVRLTDDGVQCGTNFAGADIDAVAAIGSTLRFVLDGAVLFDMDSTDLRSEAQAALDALAKEIADAGLTTFRVVGHTDSVGSDSYNQTLSLNRANAVKDYLTAQPVLAGAVITSKGRGEAEPIAENATEDGRRQNRRVEIIGN